MDVTFRHFVVLYEIEFYSIVMYEKKPSLNACFSNF